MFMSSIGCSGAFASLEPTWLRIQLHQSRVAELSKALALHIGLTRKHAAKIADAGALHDIGKFLIPAHYFQKTLLSDSEWEAIRQHPNRGYAILSSCRQPALRLAAVVALQHHERWDGSGYPHQLSGEQICLEARIVSICDVYDALRHDRPYHAGINHEEAVRIIELGDRRSTPGMFDPEVQKVFLEFSSHFAEIYADQRSRKVSPKTANVSPSDLLEKLSGGTKRCACC